MACDIRIGTSGYHYQHWVGTFYPPKTPAAKMLEYYIQHFDTLELNNSFYRLPTISAFECWRDSTPRNFVFCRKGKPLYHSQQESERSRKCAGQHLAPCRTLGQAT